MKEKNGSKKINMLIILLVIIAVIAIGISIWAIWFKKPETKPQQDYAPQQVDKNAESVSEKSTEKMEQPKGGGSVSLTYSKEVTISLKDKKAIIMFQNPAKSNQNMKVELAIDNKTIAKSGRLDPGFKITLLDDVDTDKLSEGNYEGKFIISYYDSESGEKAILNTEIPVNITVKQ